MVMKLPFQLSSEAGQAPSHLPPVEDKQTAGRDPKQQATRKLRVLGTKNSFNGPIKSPRIFFNPLVMWLSARRWTFSTGPSTCPEVTNSEFHPGPRKPAALPPP